MTETPVSPNEQRDHLANVRTMLSWVRTAVTIMGLGFVVAKFGIVLDEMPGHHHTLNLHLAAAMGTALVIAGGLVLIVALGEFIAVSRAIRSGTVYFRWWVMATLSILLLGVGVALAFYLIATA